MKLPAANRRTVFSSTLHALALLLATSITLVSISPAQAQQQAEDQSLRIGIIGTGRIGGALARHWVAAGHEVFMSSRHPEELEPLAAELGPRAHVGMPCEAAAFGTIVLVSIPYGAMPQIGTDCAEQLEGKIVLDTSNPVENRDGAMALEAQRKGAGIATAEFLRGTRVVRAFNCIPAAALANDGNRQPERIAIPIGGDDAEAIRVAERLVSDAGFDAVVVGSLADTRRFDLGQPLASGQFTAAELRQRIAQ
jgi:predicted dinucleotide-binding enzyme